MPSSDQPSRSARSNNWRTNRRARSHESAHAALPPEAASSALPDHPLVPRGEASLITTDAELQQLIGHLRATGRFAYDSEFIGELTYFPKLCLIQVATDQQVVLIDPLAELDLKPFWELIADPQIEKVVHSSQQDLEPVIRHLGREPANIFDTQIAAGFIGMAYPVSLSKLANEMLGVRLGKGLTFSHWDQRPLSAMQLRYAADDVRYLPALREQIGRRLESLGHTAWAREECDALGNAALYQFDPETQYLRIRGASNLAPKNLAVLRELTAWRDAVARAHDVPPRTFLRDDILLTLARSPLSSVGKLQRVRGLPRPVELAHGAEIVEATARALSLPPADLPPPQPGEQSPTERFRSDALWAATQCLSIGRSIDPDLVANRQEIARLYRHLAEGAPADEIRLLHGWRRKAVGEPLMNLVRNNARVTFEWSGGSLRAL